MTRAPQRPADGEPRKRLAAALWLLADLEQAASARKSFRARAYREAVWSLDDLSPGLSDTAAEMTEVSGIGVGIANLVIEFRDTGRIDRLDRLKVSFPRQSRALLRLPRMSTRSLRRLKDEFGVDELSDLARLIDQGGLVMPGVGPRTLSMWQARLVEAAPGGLALFDAFNLARRFGRHVALHTGAGVEPTGGMRRLDEVIDPVEVLIVGGKDVPRFLRDSALVEEASRSGSRVELSTVAGSLVAHLSPQASAGSTLLETTGPEEHVAALRTAFPARVIPATATEEDLYRQAGSVWVPPPARAGDVPVRDRLVLAGDLRGDLHVHTDWSPDGRQTLDGVVSRAAERGLRYLAITDHGAGLRFGGLTVADIEQQREAIESLRAANPDLLVLHGAELNIGRDGSLDYPDEVLSMLDFRLAGIHSHFDLEVGEQTERLLAVVEGAMIHAISHPSSRRIRRRPPIWVDWPRIYRTAARAGTALEVNGHLDRLDLNAAAAAEAAELSVLLVANSDAHRPGELANVANSAGVLQRARVDPALVVNTWDQEHLLTWLEDKTARPGAVGRS